MFEVYIIEKKLYNIDIDECEIGSDLCDGNAECNNTEGSYLCKCTVGYSGDGYSCRGFYRN